ncbi:MAG TPA: hypothetical protein PLQ35_14645 [bacterium]|nr:hypothetical protein [bacterium]
MSQNNMEIDPLRQLRVYRLCYCPHLVPLNNNGRVFCVPSPPFPDKEECPECPLRVEEQDVPARLRGQIRRLGFPVTRQRARPVHTDDEDGDDDD